MSPKKRQEKAILSIDPSWRGFGIVFYSKIYGKFSTCYDITNGLKNFKSAKVSTKLVYNILLKLVEEYPCVLHASTLVIENQFKPNMKYLMIIVVNQLQMLLGKELRIHYVSALSCKRHFNIALQKNHQQNKKAAIKFVTLHPQLKCQRLNLNNDNICDAIILLNYALEKLQIEMDDIIKVHQKSNLLPCCTNCKQIAILRLIKKEDSKFKGQYFQTCANAKESNPACKSGVPFILYSKDSVRKLLRKNLDFEEQNEDSSSQEVPITITTKRKLPESFGDEHYLRDIRNSLLTMIEVHQEISKSAKILCNFKRRKTESRCEEEIIIDDEDLESQTY